MRDIHELTPVEKEQLARGLANFVCAEWGWTNRNWNDLAEMIRLGTPKLQEELARQGLQIVPLEKKTHCRVCGRPGDVNLCVSCAKQLSLKAPNLR